MKIFTLTNKTNDTLTLHLKEVPDFPHTKSYEGGYDILCTLTIKIGCYNIQCENYFSATEPLHNFATQLKSCYETLEGTAEYKLKLENNLSFTVTMISSGHATIKGTFQEDLSKENIFTFEMQTDQSYFPPVISGIEEISNTLIAQLPK